MAAQDVYANSNLTQAGVLTGLMEMINSGTQLGVAFATIEHSADYDSGSVLRLFPDRQGNEVPLLILIGCDALTGTTDAELGLYESKRTGPGTVISKGVFMTGQTLANAVALSPAAAINGLAAVDIANRGKKLFEHAGHTAKTKKRSYDIAMTLDTAADTTGTISAIYIYAQG